MIDTLDLLQLAIFGFATGLGTTFGAKLASVLFEKLNKVEIKVDKK